MSARDDAQRRQKRGAGEGGSELQCRCGHPRSKHTFGRARCTVMVEGDTQQVPCGCVQFAPPDPKGIWNTALDLDEQLEVARQELEVTRGLLQDVLSDELESGDAESRQSHRVFWDYVEMRRGIEAIVNGPTSSRAEVQAALLNLLARLPSTDR